MHPIEISRPIHHAGWVYEEKVDGWRMVALKSEGSIRLVSRNGLDHTKRFPDLVKALTALKPATFTLDGEVAVYDAELVSHFEWLRHDLLQLGEHDYRPEPLRVRRKVLEKVVKGQRLILPARRLASNGFAAWTEVLHRGWEGYVAKDPESRYVPGRTLKWLKVKQKDYRKEARGFYRE